MEQNKDQSGAAASGKVDLQARLPASGPLTEVVTTIFRRARTSDTEACTFSASSVATPVAAVRGEAVVDIAEVDKHLEAVLRAGGSSMRYFSMPKAVSDMRDAIIEAMRSNAVQVSARAADAPSEPSESLCAAVMNIPCARTMSHFVRVPEMVAYKEGHRDALCAVIDVIAAVKSRAADALDSQPTEPDGLPPLPEPIEVGGEGWDLDDFKSEKTFSCEHMWAYARAAIASSQPTDGGVRNEAP